MPKRKYRKRIHQCEVCGDTTPANFGIMTLFRNRGHLMPYCLRCLESHVAKHPERNLITDQNIAAYGHTPRGEKTCLMVYSPSDDFSPGRVPIWWSWEEFEFGAYYGSIEDGTRLFFRDRMKVYEIIHGRVCQINVIIPKLKPRICLGHHQELIYWNTGQKLG